MIHKIFTFITVFTGLNLLAASGDVTTVIVHENQDIHWQGSSYGGKYDEVGVFPDATKNFQEIKFSFSVGCNNAGVCSHWDYDMEVYVGEYTGLMDSTIASIDTVQFTPLELDTTWNVFAGVIWHEIGRMITPYGTYMDDGNLNDGWDRTWLHTYTYDATDFRKFLTGSAPVRVHYHGWEDGWRVTTKFEFVEGKPTRDVVDVKNIYKGGSYTTSAQFEADIVPAKTIQIPADATAAKLKVIVTGHGQHGEFTKHSYTVKSGANVVGKKEMWRYDCGMLAIAPQGGTWIYNRANWCPGDKVEVHEFDMSQYIVGTGNNKTLDVNIDFDVFNVPNNDASYSLSAQLVTYKDIRRKYDAMVEEIIAPTNNENFARMNTICANPMVKIKNLGSETLTSLEIKYWVNTSNYRYYQWTGSLEMDESEEVTLDQMDWTGVDVANPKFTAEVNWPNGVLDQFKPNNTKVASFKFPDVYASGDLKIRFKANNKASENSYTLKDAAGNILLNKSGFANNSTNDEALNLEDGCYVFEFYDVDNYWGLDGGGDGIAWWVNTQNGLETAGYLRFLNGSNNITLKTFNPDFGSKIFYSFTVANNLSELPALPAHQTPEHPAVETIVIDGEVYEVLEGMYYGENEIISAIGDLDKDIDMLQVYPNPANSLVSLYLKTATKETIKVSLQTIIGEEIDAFEMQTNQVKNYKLKEMSNGVYLLRFEINGKSTARKLVVNK